MFNINLITKCRKASTGMDSIYRDAYYIISCLNQYEYPNYMRGSLGGQNNQASARILQERRSQQERRNQVLLFGLFRPLSKMAAGTPTPEDVNLTKYLLTDLSFILRTQRRQGVYPQILNVIWFLLAFVVSLILAFADIGDNATAHSLALGLLLFWLPVLVAVMIVDRNPVSPSRCKALIERWLYNVDVILQQAQSQSPNYRNLRWWNQGDNCTLRIGDFVGQGRRLRYCGVANAVLKWAGSRTNGPNFYANDDINQTYINDATNFDSKLTVRPKTWWLSFIMGQLVVSVGVFMAFVVSFFTPTVGMGCRSFSYLLFWVLSSVTWVVQCLWQEPGGVPIPGLGTNITTRLKTIWAYLGQGSVWITYFTSIFASIGLPVLMLIQVIGAFNNCYCKSSLIGGGGRYIDFENANFYKTHFHVKNSWAPPAAFGLFVPVGYMCWVGFFWVKNSPLWSSSETLGIPLQSVAQRADREWLL